MQNRKENLTLKVDNDWAWLICDNIWEWETEGETLKQVNIQINFLEKIDGNWKFSFQAYVPNSAPVDEDEDDEDEDEDDDDEDEDDS